MYTHCVNLKKLIRYAVPPLESLISNDIRFKIHHSTMTRRNLGHYENGKSFAGMLLI